MLSQLKQQVLEQIGHCNVARIKSELGISGDARKAEFWQLVLEKINQDAETEVITFKQGWGDSVGIALRLPKSLVSIPSLDTDRDMAAKVLCHSFYQNEIALHHIKVDRVEIKEGLRVVQIEATIYVGVPVLVNLTFDQYYKTQQRFETLQEIESNKDLVIAQCREKNLTCSWKFDPNFEVTFFDDRDRKVGKISQCKKGWEINQYDSYLANTVSSLSVAIDILFDRHKEKLESVDKLSNYLINKFS